MPATSVAAAPTSAFYARRCVAVLVLTATVFSGRLEGAQTQPVAYGGPGCIDFWIVSTCRVPPGRNPAEALDRIVVWHREPAGWIAYSYSAFVASTDTNVPVCFYVNGIFTSAESAGNESQKLFVNVGAGLPPFRGVHWQWPSDYEYGVSLREQVNRALARSQMESLYLATTIESLRTVPTVSLVGHSLGCQIVAETLARLGRCRSAAPAIAGPCGRQPPHLQAALIAPAIDPCSLSPGGALDGALRPVDRLLLTYNPDDVALHIYEQIHQRRALGLDGLSAITSVRTAKVIQIDAGPAVFFRHSASIYYDSPRVAEWLRGFVSGG